MRKNSPSSSHHEQGYKVLIVIFSITGGILHSVIIDIVLTIKGNLDVFFLLWEDDVAVMMLPLNLFICVNLLQELSALDVTIFK